MAFAALLSPYRAELHAHAYRMLASVHDADDALQETLLRAWRSLGRFEGRSSLRSWLYTITTNTSLNLIAKRPRRALPIDFGPRTDPRVGPGEPVVESVWIEPYPDDRLAAGTVPVSPEASYEMREGVELAFVAALQHLPPTQRAVLILREVLGFSAKEVAGALETTVASINSALQRARKALRERTPEQSQQQTLRALGDEAVSALVERYMDAWERDDVAAVVSMLTEDAAISMPPLRSWFGGREDVGEFLSRHPLSGALRWKTVRATANGQPAIAFYAWDEARGCYSAFALNVLSFRGTLISDVVAFVARATEGSSYDRWQDEAPDPERMQVAFRQFGLPDSLPADAPRDGRTAGAHSKS
jgi:RNA polymerase sigma-70 factor, ECF subfamily